MANTMRILDGKAGTTQQVASTDTAQALPTSSVKLSGINSNGAIISVETNAIRYVFNATPTQAGLGHYAAAGSVIVLNNAQMVNTFRFISSANGVHGTLQITPII